MLTLIQNTLAKDSSAIHVPKYNPTELTAGIAHIGVGNFHRAHQAYYTNNYLNLTKQTNWGIRGIGITASGKSMATKFANQDSLYTLTEYLPNGSSNVSVVGAIMDYVAASDDPEKAIEYLADPAIRIVSLTITEGGYNMDENGNFRLDTPAIRHDLANPGQPETAFGYVTEALARRRERGSSPFTILSCDNLQHNGNVAKKAFLSFAYARNPELANWIDDQVTFPNSMVDRITPTVDDLDRLRLNAESGINDAMPVYCEDFTEWVIEDNFCAGRPDWELAGVTFVDDVAPYEALKLRFLNASHSMLAYPAFLSGYRTVHEAMNDNVFSNYISVFINHIVTPLVTPPDPVDLTDYKNKLVSRLSNAAVSDQLARLCFDGASKLPTFLLPTLSDLAAQNKPTYCIAFLIAAYGHYLRAKSDDKGTPYTVDEPFLLEDDWLKIRDTDELAFLDTSPLASANLRSIPHFAAAYKLYRKQIAIYGVAFSLRQAMCTFWETI
ncbi:mannitol dehydrogenase family protein [Spirosoma endbachense]|uniref:Mannitol dehydrogenase family protein n=1 Tax=Spirosoma endbachense TaxID=2666025 RepID=A0A6P1VNW7_9BACT|nr:mannitol dehydrogenase family protein [Spirosoma endbachense]QHV94951.1 mannitol dehydrogenase family protein [Spirosoma endbachense]